MKRYSGGNLVHIVMYVWRDGDLNKVIDKVFDRIERVLILINEDKGGNDLLETKRGKEHANIKFDFNLNAQNISSANSRTIFFDDEDDEVIMMDVEI